jgi:signal transduction histidine kinase
MPKPSPEPARTRDPRLGPGPQTSSILIVDDDPRNRLALRAVLESLGHRLVEADSATTAFAAVCAEEFALLLLDAMMPGTDGVGLVRMIRDHGIAERTPIVFLSALGPDSPQVRAAYDLGVLDFISKPMDPYLLRAKVRSLVALYERGIEIERQAKLIVEQRRAQKETEAVVSELLEVSSAIRAQSLEKDRYVGMLGHDLRTPLNAILTGTTILLQAPDLPARHKGTVGRIARSAHRMALLVRDVLDFARGAAGTTIPVNRAPADLGAICADVVDELRLAHPERTISLERRGDLEGQWDRERIEQVVSNLVGNALEHSATDVVVSVVGDAEGVRLVVENGGDAIPAELLGHLFEPFRKGARPSKGLGLGLYIAKQIVAAHGGVIDVVSAGGVTRFTARCPRGR